MGACWRMWAKVGKGFDLNCGEKRSYFSGVVFFMGRWIGTRMMRI